jgi:hypothetical protein
MGWARPVLFKIAQVKVAIGLAASSAGEMINIGQTRESAAD